jgi:hypothetical protein
MKIQIVSGTKNSYVGRIITIDYYQNNSYIKIPELNGNLTFLYNEDGEHIKLSNSHITLIGIIINE